MKTKIKTKIKTIWHNYKALIIISVFGLIIDFLLKCHPNIPHIPVDSEYIGIVFGGLCAFSAIGSALQAIIIGANGNKILGFSVLELLEFHGERTQISGYVTFPLISVIVAVPFLAIEFCTTVSLITVIVLIRLTHSSWRIWAILSDEQCTVEIIEKQINGRLAKDITLFFNAWFPELKRAIIENDGNRQNTYIGLIKKAVCQFAKEDKGDKEENNNKEDISTTLTRYLSMIFPESCKHLGFVEAYKKILKLNNEQDENGADINGIIKKYIYSLKYCQEGELREYKIENTINDIIEKIDADKYDKQRYVYWYYKAALNNKSIATEVRYEVLDSVFNKLCYLDDTISGELRGQIILMIFREDILENESIEERNEIMQMLVNNLIQENFFACNKGYISVVAQIFRKLYFYCIYEKETLTVEYREHLAELYNYAKEGKDNYRQTFSLLVRRNIKEIIEWLLDDAIHYNSIISDIEYFPQSSMIKPLYVEKEKLVQFAFCLHIAFFNEEFFLTNEEVFSARKFVENHENSIKLRWLICKSIVSLYEDKSRLTYTGEEMLDEMYKFIGAAPTMLEHILQANFTLFNNELRRINEEQALEINQKNSLNEQDIMKAVNHRLEKGEMLPFKYNKNLSLDNGVYVAFLPMMYFQNRVAPGISSRRVFVYIREALRKYSSYYLPVEEIGFNIDGVNRLLELLKGNEYKFRNYEYVNKLVIDGEIRNTDEFKKLKKEIEQIKYKEGYDLETKIFLKTEDIEFNVSLLERDLKTPTKGQCQQYLKNYKIAEGKYRISEAIYDFDSAIQYLQKTHLVESIVLHIVTNITSDSGFRVIPKIDRKAEIQEKK